jgi:hypothetical protein
MKSFRKEITEQIERIPKGRIFTTKDLTFEVSKTANVNVLLADLVKKNRIMRIEKGTYYIPKESKLGLGPLPLPQNEIVRYLTRKYGGYLSGYCVYNMMGLTEQVPAVLTIATPNPVRPFRFDNLRFNCIKAHRGSFEPHETKYLMVLDAINDMEHIPGKTGDMVFQRLKIIFFNEYTDKETRVLTKLAMYYPKKVQRTVIQLLTESGKARIAEELKAKI